MDIELTVKNYRCFSENHPLRITVKKGFTSFVGANNSGKSTILKFFYEFRSLFQLMTNYDSIGRAFRVLQAFNYPPTIFDMEEVFHNLNGHDLTIELKLEILNSPNNPVPVPVKLVLTVPRGRNEFSAFIELSGSRVNTEDIAVDNS